MKYLIALTIPLFACGGAFATVPETPTDDAGSEASEQADAVGEADTSVVCSTVQGPTMTDVKQAGALFPTGIIFHAKFDTILTNFVFISISASDGFPTVVSLADQTASKLVGQATTKTPGVFNANVSWPIYAGRDYLLTSSDAAVFYKGPIGYPIVDGDLTVTKGYDPSALGDGAAEVASWYSFQSFTTCRPF